MKFEERFSPVTIQSAKNTVIINIQKMQDICWGVHASFEELNNKEIEILWEIQSNLIPAYNETISQVRKI